MSQADLNRVREDLATIQHAARLELPFGKEDVRTSLWSAVCGLFITLWAVFAPWEYRWVVLVPLVAAVMMTIPAPERKPGVCRQGTRSVGASTG